MNGLVSVEKEYLVELKAMPSLLSLYRKIFFDRKPGWDEEALPQIQVRTTNVELSAKNVSDYAAIESTRSSDDRRCRSTALPSVNLTAARHHFAMQ